MQLLTDSSNEYSEGVSKSRAIRAVNDNVIKDIPAEWNDDFRIRERCAVLTCIALAIYTAVICIDAMCPVELQKRGIHFVHDVLLHGLDISHVV